jgi:hypothetical protein
LTRNYVLFHVNQMVFGHPSTSTRSPNGKASVAVCATDWHTPHTGAEKRSF